MREAEIRRETTETAIRVRLVLDGSGTARIATGIGFFDHMLEHLSRHARIDLNVEAKCDTHVDFHHVTEDVCIALGQAVRKALGDMKGLTRYAAGNRAEIVRREREGAPPEVIRVRLSDLVRAGDVSQDVPMRPGDTLVIPQGWF